MFRQKRARRERRPYGLSWAASSFIEYCGKTHRDRIAFSETASCATLLTTLAHPVFRLFQVLDTVLQKLSDCATLKT
jgi:hypothetical protein